MSQILLASQEYVSCTCICSCKFSSKGCNFFVNELLLCISHRMNANWNDRNGSNLIGSQPEGQGYASRYSCIVMLFPLSSFLCPHLCTYLSQSHIIICLNQAECEELQARVESLSNENRNLRDELQRLSEECEKLTSENNSIKVWESSFFCCSLSGNALLLLLAWYFLLVIDACLWEKKGEKKYC